MDTRRLFLEHLGAIERIARETARRHRLRPEDAEDFVGNVRLRILEDDCRILREFREQSSASTYLTTVISRLFLDYRTHAWGRWRPSARALTLGADAVALERLVYHDGMRVLEAVQTRVTANRGRTTERQLYALWSQLPARFHRGSAGRAVELLDDHWVDPAPDPVTEAQDAVAARRALSDAYASLTPAERLLLELHFGRGVPLVHVARMSGVSRATIMRRLAAALAAYRRPLLSAGVTTDVLRHLIHIGAVKFGLLGKRGPAPGPL